MRGSLVLAELNLLGVAGSLCLICGGLDAQNYVDAHGRVLAILFGASGSFMKVLVILSGSGAQ